MKILLVYPYFIEERIQAEDIECPPIGLYWVAALLKEHGYDVEILNWYDALRRPEEIRGVLGLKRPDIIGFSILHANRWGGIEIARIARELNPDVKIVLGGPGATFLWRHLLTHFPVVDFVVIGEGEIPFLELVQHVEKGKGPLPDGIRGIAFRRGGKIVRTQRHPFISNLDELPIPSKYFEYRHVSSTRGCAWNCRFCGSPALWGGRIRFRSPGHFVEELELLYRKGITFFYVSDDAFTVDRERVIDICRRILEKGLKITWYAISRVDCVDEKVLAWMRRAGCIQISYGIESGSERIRKVLNKRITTGQVKKAFALTREYGILPRAYFIYGSPGETWETVEETVTLIREIQPLGAVFYILDLYPGTAFYARLMKSGHFTEEFWLSRVEGLMYLETDPRLSDELVLAFGSRLRTAFYEEVHSFADSISLVEREDLYAMHADFCSRLGMTFSHGDYARNESVREKNRIAEKLYRKALGYSPDERAYLGLGILKQKAGDFRASIDVLSEAIRHFPESESLHICLGISHMNAQDYRSALSSLSRFSGSEQAKDLIERCSRVLKGIDHD
ncbi:MAG: B12-binding domain-containing radical SAM protein [Deltaproteobacteria bacterium]|nr:B12-binding domain-containing radical SAM protein [Deltaproteobacteria bacterium]